jgi:hypothetical protein
MLLELPEAAQLMIGEGRIALSAIDPLRAIGTVSPPLLDALIAFLAEGNEVGFRASSVRAGMGAATWLDAAGVRPKVASVLMGHFTAARQPGAAPITLTRYTHALPADVERARGQLNAYLAERTQERSRVK